MRVRFLLFLMPVLLVAACRAAPSPSATATPSPTPMISPSTTAVPTVTPLASQPPLPTEIPLSARQAVRVPQRAEIRVIHAAPTVAELDAYLDDSPVAFRLGYLDAGGQADVEAGEYTLRLVPAGGSAGGVTSLSTSITLAAGASVIAVAMPNDEIRLYDENDAPLRGDETRVQVIHAVENAPATTTDGPDGFGRAFDPLAFGVQSEGTVYPAGETTFDFENLLNGYEVELRPRRVYTLVLAGDLANPRVIAADSPVPARAALTFVNASEAAGEVDVYLSGELTVQGLGFREEDNYSQLAVNSYQVAIYAVDADPTETSPLVQSQVVLNPDDEVFALVIGAGDDLQLVTYRGQTTLTGADQTRIAFLNAVRSVPQLEEVRNDQAIRVTYGQTTVIEFPAGARDFEFVSVENDAGDPEIVDFIAERDFEAGRSYFVVLTGQGADGDSALILDRTVGAEEAPVPTEQQVPDDPRMYFVNASDRPVDLVVDGTVMQNRVLPTDRSEIYTFAARSHTLTMVDANTEAELYTAQRVLEADKDYTVVLWGNLDADNYAVSVFPVRNPQFADEATTNASLRLINVSLEASQRFAVGYTPVLPADSRPTNLIATQAASGGTNRLVEVPLNITGLPGLAVASGEASDPINLPEGRYDIYVYDTNATNIMAAVYDVRLDAGRFYEVVVTGQPSTTPHTAFLLRNPLR